MNLPPNTLAKMQAAAEPADAKAAVRRRWQVSLRTLFMLTTACCILAWFAQPLMAWAAHVWEVWFPSSAPIGCGPCGMG